MLIWRLASAAVGIPILLLVIVIGGTLYSALLALTLFAAVGELLLQAGLSARRPMLWVSAATAGALPFAARAGPAWPGGILAAGIVLSLLAALSGNAEQPSARQWPLAVAVAVYVGWLGQYLALIRFGEQGQSWMLFALFAAFASDTAAYSAGRLVGRHRLAPRISPSKTWEGAAGGLLGCGVAAVLLNRILGPPAGVLAIFCLGLGLSVAAQLGDLCESALKRSLSVKDAGWLVPGHGGLLDRLDSLLVVGFVVYWVVQWTSL